MNTVYIGLGGNIGDSKSVLKQGLDRLALLADMQSFKSSCLYETTPVSAIPQNPYLNAVCTFKTSLSPSELLAAFQKIEKDLGKQVKAKDEPRIIDLDLLFYGTEYCNERDLQLPHPRWKERLFVLVPLLELTFTVPVFDGKELVVIDLCELAKNFKNTHNEVVRIAYA